MWLSGKRESNEKAICCYSSGACYYIFIRLWPNSLLPYLKKCPDFEREKYECEGEAYARANNMGLRGNAFAIGGEFRKCMQIKFGWYPCQERNTDLRKEIPRAIEIAAEESRKEREKLMEDHWRRIGFSIHQVSDALNPVVWKVNPGSPAANQGVKVGDIITERDGNKITTAGEFRAWPVPKKGEWVEYKVLRDTTELTFKIRVE